MGCAIILIVIILKCASATEGLFVNEFPGVYNYVLFREDSSSIARASLSFQLGYIIKKYPLR